MFHLVITPQTKTQMPLLSDILHFLYMAFNFILARLKNFYDPKDKNIAFLTLMQSPMLNAINSGKFFLIIASIKATLLRRIKPGQLRHPVVL